MSKIREIWKAIPGFEGKYEVSNLGRVKSLARETKKHYSKKGEIRKTFIQEKILKSSLSPAGYETITLHTNDTPAYRSVHRLVMLAFSGESELHVDHKNGNKTDNRLSNLQYLSPVDNICKSAKMSKSGYRGVHEDEYSFRYMVRAGGVRYAKRGFKSASEASKARCTLMEELGIELSKYNS